MQLWPRFLIRRSLKLIAANPFIDVCGFFFSHINNNPNEKEKELKTNNTIKIVSIVYCPPDK